MRSDVAQNASSDTPETSYGSLPGKRLAVRGWTNDPCRNSLGLLPSGPDPIGEGLVHCQPLKRTISHVVRVMARGEKQQFHGDSAMWSNFQLDERLEVDSLRIVKLWLCDLRIMKDANYPWLLLIPRRDNLVEIIDLKPDERMQLMLEISKVSEALKAYTGCHKLNVAQLGNMVRQLHVHVIARFEGDAAWPGPVWGAAPPKDWDEAARDALMASLKQTLALPADRKN